MLRRLIQETVWQDWVITTLQIVFTAALIPTIMATGQKPALMTALTTAAGALIFSFTMLTLKLRWTAFFMLINGLAWMIISYQSWNL